MSTAVISYRSLKDASNESKSVSKKLNAYADSIERSVYNKLNKYSGDVTDNISTAKRNAGMKISALRSQASRYSTYSDNLIGLRDECKSVDKAVKSKVSSLTASFKNAYGIRDSKIENAINYFFTSIGNSTAVGRWISGAKDTFNKYSNYIKDRIREWYNYEGGKDLIKGVLVGFLEIAIGILSIVAAVISGAALIVIIAGVIAGVIAVANGIVNMYNEGRAYNATQHDDPATGKRLSAENTMQDFLRDGDITDENGSGLFGVNDHVKLSRGIANTIDVVNFCCTVITVVSSAGKLLKNGYKWATGSSAALKDITMKDIFSKEFFKGIGSKFSSGFKDIKLALKFKDWSIVKDFGIRLFSDFKFNLNNRFANFSEFKKGVGTVKNILSVSKDLINGGFNLKNIAKTGFEKVVIPCVTVFTVTKDTPGIITGKDGQLSFDFFDRVTIDDFYGIADKIGSKIIGSPVFQSESTLNGGVMTKLASSSNISISIPEITIPEIHVEYAV